ncbi:DUF1285 domain-containing protein [Alkalimonas amylolytica]|uniref:DUF1285 domain-containing protein n=1 Tax=Alkalimonas amylolytica TaxID=152573 RepID=A0A1H4DEG2_ALKAM|nr:DUF1285 domain-containing protein [Alkalimonas amylolytica]SEA70830.1 hypothetical protein SAMN04488051_105198 [Alkalimonas amylolytica]
MLSLQALQQQLEQQQAPLESWDPPFCGDMALRIAQDGQWLYQNSPIGRLPLVKLFASVLVKEGQEYFLKTPVEKVRIQVEDVPFLIHSWHWQQTSAGLALIAVTNLGDQLIISHQHPIRLQAYQEQQVPYIGLWRGLEARLSRNVYYQWIEQAQQCKQANPNQLWLQSADYRFLLGEL